MRKMCIGLLCALLLTCMAVSPAPATAQATASTGNIRYLFVVMMDALSSSDYAEAREAREALEDYYTAPEKDDKATYDWSGWEYVRDFLGAWDTLGEARASENPAEAKEMYGAVYEAMVQLALQSLGGNGKMPDKCRQLAVYAQARIYELDGYFIHALNSYKQIEKGKMVDDTLLQEGADSPERQWQDIWQDAANSIIACQKAVYSAGVELYNQGAYQKSKEQFAAITDYLDSGSWIDKCDQAIAQKQDSVPVDLVLGGLKFVQVTSTSMTVQWDSNLTGFAYEIVYAPQYVTKNVTRVTTQATQAELTGLIPSTRYALTVRVLDGKAEPLSGEQNTGNADPFTDYRIKWPTMALYSYKQADASNFGIKHVVDTNKIVQVNDANLLLPRFRIADDTAGTGYVILVSFMCEKTEADKVCPWRFVLRIRDGGTFEKQSTETIAGGNTFISLFAPLDGLLDAHYEENNGWKEAAATVDFYLRDQFMLSFDFTLRQ